MRKVKKLIVHCTATPEGREVSINQITRWHKERGFRTIGYHYVIALDGTIKKGRDISEVGAHCKGQNTNSIGISYVGGLDHALNAKDTRTDSQKKAMTELIAELKEQFPGVTIHGHNEFSNKACPSFDVQELR